MKEFVIKGRLTLERVTFHVSAKTLEGALARVANGDFDGYDTDRPKALIGTWLWLRSRRTPDAPPPANASCFATINPVSQSNGNQRAAPSGSSLTLRWSRRIRTLGPPKQLPTTSTPWASSGWRNLRPESPASLSPLAWRRETAPSAQGQCDGSCRVWPPEWRRRGRLRVRPAANGGRTPRLVRRAERDNSKFLLRKVLAQQRPTRLVENMGVRRT